MSSPREKQSRYSEALAPGNMIETWKRSELDRLSRAHGLRYSKALGQNFLTDRNVLEKIAEAAGLSPDDHVIEIGPGLGALTVFLAQAAGRVTAVEIDRRLIPALREAVFGLPDVDIVNEDFLKYSLPEGPFKIAGNLPYNITTPIIAKLYEQPRPGSGGSADGAQAKPDASASGGQPRPGSGVSADGAQAKPDASASGGQPKHSAAHEAPCPPGLAVLMVQKEVAERLVSPPGKKAYGAISVLVQYYTGAEILFPVSREVFVPKPGVDSAVIRLRPRDLSGDSPAVAARMFRLVRAGFDMRRKTLRNSLARAGYTEEALLAALEASGIDPGRRAETLSPREFYTLAGHCSRLAEI